MIPKNKYNFKKYLNDILSYVPSKFILNFQRKKYIIIMYHRVVDDNEFDYMNDPNFGLSVSKSNFERQINYISNNYEVVSIDNILESNNSSLEDLSVIITFDDGYKDNYLNAYPILKKYFTPATIYVSTRFIEGETWTWWYDLWNFIKKSDYFSFENAGLINKTYINHFSDKIRIYDQISKLFIKLDYQSQLDLMSQIDANFSINNNPYLFMNWNEVKKLDESGLITIGAHTHTHASLKNMSEKTAFNEIKKSKDLIEKNLNKEILHFAYPYGKSSNFSVREEKILKKLGFKTSVTTLSSNNSNSLYKLPRTGIDNTSTEKNICSKFNGSEQLIRNLIRQ